MICEGNGKKCSFVLALVTEGDQSSTMGSFCRGKEQGFWYLLHNSREGVAEVGRVRRDTRERLSDQQQSSDPLLGARGEVGPWDGGLGDLSDKLC